MKKVFSLLATGVVSLVTVLSFMTYVAPATTMAAPGDVLDESCAKSGGSALCEGRDQKLFGPGSVFQNIINTLIFIIGAVSVVMIIIGGFRYTVSNGDQGQLTSAKNTILYAIIGIVVAILSYAIVNFVIGRL